MKPSVYYSTLALPSSEMWLDIAFRCVCGRCNVSDIDGYVRFFSVTEYYVKEKRSEGASTVAALLFSMEPAINSHSASTGKLQKRDGSVHEKTIPCSKLHGWNTISPNVIFQMENNTEQFRLKNKNVLPQCKCAFPHFNTGPIPGAVAIPGHTHNGTGQHRHFETKTIISKILNWIEKHCF